MFGLEIDGFGPEKAKFGRGIRFILGVSEFGLSDLEIGSVGLEI